MKGNPWPVVRLAPSPAAAPRWWAAAGDGAELPWDGRFLRGGGGGPALLEGRPSGGDGTVVLATGEPGSPRWQVDIEAWLLWILREEYRPVHRAPLHARLPFAYHRIPPGIRSLALKALNAVRGYRGDPAAAVPPLAMCAGFELVRGMARAAPSTEPVLVLTHDVDTAQGFEWARRIAACEEERGFRSSWNVVTSDYPIDHATVEWLAGRGHEIGIHGESHDNRLPFREEGDMRRRFEGMVPFRDRYGVRGFRSPSWCRTPRLFDHVREHFAYDTSCLDVDQSCPSGRGGVGSTRPFFLRDGLVEVPATIPFEAPAFRGVPWGRVPDCWAPKVAWLREAGGHLVVNTHPDSHFSGNAAALDAYAEFLSRLRGTGIRCVLPGDAARVFRDGGGA